MRLTALCLVVGLAAGMASLVQASSPQEPIPTPALPDGLYAEFVTPRGSFVAELEFKRVPMTVSSFVGRAEGWLGPREGKPFFTGLKWYRVVPNFVLQSGDPVRSAAADPSKLTEVDEAAGHPFTFPDEIAPGLHHARAGVLSMANGGPDTNSSEFFITLRDTNRLNYLHSVFGQVIRGIELLPQVKPDEPFSIRIHRIGAEAKAFDASEAAFTARVAAAKKYAFTTEPGLKSHFADPDGLMPTEPPRAKNFNFKLANFERFTGVRVHVQLFAKAPADWQAPTPGQRTGTYMRKVARDAGFEQEGVLVVYYADVDQWLIWVGNPAMLAAFAGDGTEPRPSRKEAFFHAARERGAKAAAEFAAEGRKLTDAQKLKLVVDEVIDALILTYEPTR